MESSPRFEEKYLQIFALTPSRKFLSFQLKQSCVFLSFSIITLQSFVFVYDMITYYNTFILTLLQYTLFCGLNFSSFVYLIKSLHQYEYSKARISNICLTFALLIHVTLFVVDVVFDVHFSIISFPSYIADKRVALPLNNTTDVNVNINVDVDDGDVTYYMECNYFLECTLPNFMYLVYEGMVSWFVYSYTRHLKEGNDALVDGMHFDRYVEDLGSEFNSNPSDRGRRGRFGSNNVNNGGSGNNNMERSFNKDNNNGRNMERYREEGIGNNLSFESQGGSAGRRGLVDNEII